MDLQGKDFVPTLTFEPDSEDTALAAIVEDEIAENALRPELQKLTPDEQKMVSDFASKIDITNTNAVLTYGAASQRNIANFSENTLNSVRSKDMGEVGNMLSSLVVELRGFGGAPEKKGGLRGLKRRVQNQIAAMKAEYSKVSTNVDKIAKMLEDHQITLMKDAAMLDKMYEINQAYFKELTMYILAGKQKLDECTAMELPRLQKLAAETGQPEDAQAAND